MFFLEVVDLSFYFCEEVVVLLLVVGSDAFLYFLDVPSDLTKDGFRFIQLKLSEHPQIPYLLVVLPVTDALPKVVHDQEIFLQQLEGTEVVLLEVEVDLFVPDVLDLCLQGLVLLLEVV